MQQPESHQRFDGRALGEQVVTTVRDFVSRSLRPIAARLDAHAQRAESTDLLVADLDARIAAVERQLARQSETEVNDD